MKYSCIVGIILGMTGFLGCASKTVTISRSKLLMGHVPVNISIKTSPENKENVLLATDEAYKKAQEIETKLSSYNPDSEISCLNQKAGKSYCSLSEETVKLLNFAQELRQKTEGAFDIRFASPTPQGKNGMILLLVNEGRLANPATQIKIDSLAKGYILDQMIEVLQSKGFENALVDAGGDIRASGGPWKVSIQIPDAAYGKNTKPFEIRNQALTTSANYENSKNVVDPANLKPVVRKESVSVIANSATLANGLSTALYVLGPTKDALIKNNFPGIQIFWVNQKGEIKKE